MRRGRALVAVVVAVLAVSSCHDWNRAPFGPSLPSAFGARVTDGQLHIWTGSLCVGVTRFALIFDPLQADRAELELTSRGDAGMDIEHLTLGGPYPAGLVVTRPLPEDFDWRKEDSMRISFQSSSGGWGTITELTEVIKGSSEHPPDTYWFQDVGWLNPADVAAKDGKTFLATCTPDPAKKR